jgi:hypothetical protein
VNEKGKERKTFDVPWQCANCGALLGFVSSDQEELRIKYKDLFVTVRGGDVTVICRRCARPNTLYQTRDLGLV